MPPESDWRMNSKIDVTIGDVSFSGEGEQEWLTKQLDKVIAIARPARASKSTQKSPTPTKGVDEKESAPFTASLASHLRDKKGEANQVARFLATADWLRRRNGDQTLTTALVTRSLRDNQQKRLGNPADTLNKNVKKGHCEKISGGGFLITDDGLQALGYN